MAESAKDLKEQLEELRQTRSEFDAVWAEIADLVLPRRPGNTTRLVKPRLYDATAVFANEMLAASLAGQLINPVLKWFAFRPRDKSLLRDPNAKAWFDDVRDLMLGRLNAFNSMFHTQAHELFLDLGALGTSAMFVGETTDDLIFSTRPMPEIFLRENHRGVVDSVFRVFKFTARQAKQFYGADRLPTKVTEAKKPDEPFEFLHVVLPREERDASSKSATNKPWASVHVFLDAPQVLLEGGFDDFPFMVPRWQKVSGEVYGRSQGMTVLPDVRMLQRMSEVQVMAAQLAIRPPLLVPDDGIVGKMTLVPGGLNVMRATARNKPEALVSGVRPDIGLDIMNQKRDFILRAFFFDTFERREGPEMTATEIMARREERFRRMTPMLTRTQVEFLSPLIERVFNLMLRRGEFPDPPASLSGAAIEIDFISPAALAQEASEADNMTRFLARVAPVMELDPGAAANVNADEYIREMARKFNIPQRVLADPRQVEAVRQQLAQREQMQAVAASAEQGAGAIRDLSEAARGDQE